MTPDCLHPDRDAMARDMTWQCAMRRHSGGLAAFYVAFDEDTGELFWGVMRGLDYARAREESWS